PRRDEAGDSAFLEALAKLTAAEREAVAGAANVASAPLGVDRGAETVHASLGLGRRVGSPVLTRPAGRLRRGDEDELSAGGGEPFDEFGAVGKTREDDRGRGEILLAGARAVANHLAFERADARGDQIDVRIAAAPSAPGAVLFVVGLDAPRLVLAQEPVIAGAKLVA